MARASKEQNLPFTLEKLIINSLLNGSRLIIIPPSLELPPTFQPLRPRHSSLLRNKKQALEVTVFRPIFCCQGPIRALDAKQSVIIVGNESHHDQSDQSITFHKQQ